MKINQLLVLFAALLPLALFAAGWEDFGLQQTASAPSEEKGSTCYTLRDRANKEIDVNYANLPSSAQRTKTVELKEIFFAWTKIQVEHIGFFYSNEEVHARLKVSGIRWQDTNLLPYIPAGLAFQERSDGLYYNFRVVVDFQTYMLDGKYSDEDALLAAIYGFIKEKEEPEAISTQEVSPETETVVEKEPVTHRLSAFAAPVYLIPTGKLRDITENGYGFLVGATLHDVGISLTEKTIFDLDFTLMTGFWYLDAKKRSDTESELKSAFMIPLILNARYPFVFYDRFFAAPALCVGVNYNNINYYEPVAGAEDRLVKVRAFAPSVGGGFQLGYYLMDRRLTLLAGAQHVWMFERHMTPSTFNIFAGAEYTFKIIGK